MFKKDEEAYVYCHNCEKLLFKGSIDEAVKIKCEDGHSYTCGKKSYINMVCPEIDTGEWDNENKKQYPEHDKIHLVKDKSQFIGEFLEWLQTEQKITFGEYTDENPDTLFPILHKSTEKWLALYFNIDLNKIEEERLQMLKNLREDNPE